MLTVIFSTYNGEDTLPLMLQSLVDCAAPEGGWQLIAVDNASSDDSAAILSEYEQKLPLTLLREERQGKNFALNTAIEYASGDVIVFTDDDVIADRSWLVKFRQSVDSRSDVSIFGGCIEPYWMEKPSSWILEWVDCAYVYALTPPGLQEGLVDPGRIFGPNMAIRKAVFDQGYRYDTRIGPNGTSSYIMGSETSFTKMLAAEGFTCCHLPEVKVAHIIFKQQLDRKWILSRSVRAGRGVFIEKSSHYQTYKRWFRVPRNFYRHYFRHQLRSVGFHFLHNPQKIFEEQWKAHFIKGQILQAYNYFSK